MWFGILHGMTTLLEKTIEKVRKLSAEEQGMLAELLSSSTMITGTYDASPEELAAIDRGLADAKAGRFATEEEISAIFNKYRRA